MPPRGALALVVAVLDAHVRSAAAHAVVISPRPRNAVDADLPMWRDAPDGSLRAPQPDGTPGCNESMGVCGCWCSNGTSACNAGQACFWFSQGCTIGCDVCTGVEARAQVDTCGRGARAVVCDARLRTYNRGAACNSAQDTYKHNPWRAMGTAPVFDPCGKAGGGWPKAWEQPGPGAAMFTNTTNARFGALGSVALAPGPSQASWHAGSEVEVVWGLKANHGGGYQWRLCPADQAPLTEACFQAHPLPFAGRMAILHADGTREPIDSAYAYEDGTGAFTADGQLPRPGAWAVNPLPDLTQQGSQGALNHTEFAPPCANNTDPAPPPKKRLEGLCSGNRPYHVAVIDVLRVPSRTPPGHYVLGFRWDVEETAQVWSSCSDITIVAA